MNQKKILIFAAFVLLIAVSLGLYFSERADKEPKYRSESVQRGTVVATVTATGTLSALTTVAVGSQVSGIISKRYVDFNSKVTKGQLLAEIDPTTFNAQLDQQRANLEKARVEARNAQVAFDRSKNLLANQLIARSDYDTAEANLLSAQAAVHQAEAAVRQAETSLTYTKIYSPIDGVVVDRQIDIGQTVAASFQAPTLFTIAQDLTRMQVSTNIDEADIGKIHAGIDAEFTVDAFPEKIYHGTISEVRLSPQTVQNVVTYPVLIQVPNDNLELKPGMTANVTVPYETKYGVLRIPNAALRFKPETTDTQAASGSGPTNVTSGQGSSQSGQQRSGQRSGRQSAGRPGQEAGAASHWRHQGQAHGQTNTVYEMDPTGTLRPVTVLTSITDGNYTAVEGGNLKEGDNVVIGLATTRAMQSTGGIGYRPGGGRPR